MSTPKRGFVMYFDNYPVLSALSMEQRGLLLSVLMVYADRLWRDGSATLEEVMEGFPQLAEETRVACGFMGAAVRRDTEAWLNKQEYRAKKRQERETSGAETDRRAREDMDRVRRLMEEME